MATSEETIFIIEDDPASRESLQVMIETMGFTTRSFESAESFLEQSAYNSGGCVLTDLRLRGMSGLEFLERLGNSNIPIPVILVTAYAKTPLTVRAMRRGAVNVLDKPLDEHHLWDAIREALALDRVRRDRTQSRREIQARFDALTAQELQVLKMMVGGLTNREIASHLDVSTRTIEARRHNIFRKTQTATVPDLVKLTVVFEDSQNDDRRN